MPDFFADLNLDQIIRAVTAGTDAYNLVPFFEAPLHDLDAIAYRQAVMRDLEQDPVMDAVRTFAARMCQMRDQAGRTHKSTYLYEQQRFFLGAADAYCGAVQGLCADLHSVDPASEGLRAFRDYLTAYTGSPEYSALAGQTRALIAELAAVRYNVRIKGGMVTVRRYAGEADYSETIERAFDRFRRAAPRDYRVTFAEEGFINHVHAQILDRVARLYPDLFRALGEYCAAYAAYLDDTVVRFDREIQFYVAYLTYIARFRRAGFPFCYPQLSRTSKAIDARQTFDLALAAKLQEEHATLVSNDVFLQGPERILVVTGPNQGGKTTFARTVGQVHYLASLGCPVPGTQARLFLFDRLFTHFERGEDITNLRGKLHDDLVRIRHILDHATPSSLVIMNEIFSSTTLDDAVYLSQEVMSRLSQLDLLAVCVTFLSELASFDAKTVSVVTCVDPNDPTIRTYRVERRPPSGLAYAVALAAKHRVTYEQLKGRIGS